MALNFHEFFDLKPLFEELETELEEIEEKNKLREIAKEIAGKQEALLSHIKEGMVFIFKRVLYEGEENGITVPPEDMNSYRGHRLGIVLKEIGQNEVDIIMDEKQKRLPE